MIEFAGLSCEVCLARPMCKTEPNNCELLKEIKSYNKYLEKMTLSILKRINNELIFTKRK